MESRSSAEKPANSSSVASIGLFAKSSAEQKESKEVIPDQRKIMDPITEDMISGNWRMAFSLKVTDAVAAQFKMDRDDIQRSETFETSVIRYVYALDPHAVPRLTAETDVSHNATYAATEDSILIRYDKFNKEQVLAIAKVVEQYFSGINTVIIPNESHDSMFWIRFNKDVFLKDVLPRLQSKAVPEKVAKPETPFMQLESYKSSCDFGMQKDEHGLTRCVMYR